MFIFDIEGQLVNLSNKNICIYRFDSPSAEFEAHVYTETSTEESIGHTLHQGTLAECRDFMAGLARQLDVLKIHTSSTPNKPPASPKADDDLPF